MFMNSSKIRTVAVGLGSVVLVFATLSLLAQSAPETPHASALPDVAGIRPGMPAQEAYNLLKARNRNIKIGVGQMLVPGLGEKPVVTEMRALVEDPSTPETITVWLTTPPGKQVVYAVGRYLEYDPNQPLLRSKVMESLREKYGPATDPNYVYWGFDEQGGRPDAARLRQLNCAAIAPASLMVAAPQGSTFPGISPFIYPVQPANACNDFIKVTAQLVGANGQDNTYVHQITVVVWDLHLYRQTQEAYHAYLANAAKAEGETELEKAKQRKAPKF
jgi:hypothetical protein